MGAEQHPDSGCALKARPPGPPARSHVGVKESDSNATQVAYGFFCHSGGGGLDVSSWSASWGVHRAFEPVQDRLPVNVGRTSLH